MTRTCKECTETYPATDNYFPRRNGRSTLLRTQCHSCYAIYRKGIDAKRAALRTVDTRVPVDRERCPNLDVGPIRAWLRPYVNQFDSWVAMAKFCRVDATIIRKILEDQTKTLVSLDTVDRILVAFNCSPLVLPELYPALYAFD